MLHVHAAQGCPPFINKPMCQWTKAQTDNVRTLSIILAAFSPEHFLLNNVIRIMMPNVLCHLLPSLIFSLIGRVLNN